MRRGQEAAANQRATRGKAQAPTSLSRESSPVSRTAFSSSSRESLVGPFLPHHRRRPIASIARSTSTSSSTPACPSLLQHLDATRLPRAIIRTHAATPSHPPSSSSILPTSNHHLHPHPRSLPLLASVTSIIVLTIAPVRGLIVEAIAAAAS